MNVASTPPLSYRTYPIDKIQVGHRHRQDLGDVDALARSIAAFGLLHPITIDGDGRLAAGQRRLEACRRLGWTEIPVIVLNTTLAEAETS